MKGEIVLVPFPFTNLLGSKIRPALILATTATDITVAFISSRLNWQGANDVVLKPTKENGLKKESVLKLHKLATLERDLIFGRIGNLDNATMRIVDQKLILVFKIQIT